MGGQELVVDTGNLVAFETARLQYKVNKVGGMKSFFFGGEGLVMLFSGKGRVWIQTREPQGLAGVLAPYLPQELMPAPSSPLSSNRCVGINRTWYSQMLFVPSEYCTSCYCMCLLQSCCREDDAELLMNRNFNIRILGKLSRVCHCKSYNNIHITFAPHLLFDFHHHRMFRSHIAPAALLCDLKTGIIVIVP